MFSFKLLFLFILIPREFTFFIGPFSLTPYRVLLLILVPSLIFSLISKRRFKWSLLDTLVILVSVWPMFALMVNTDFLKGMESGGILFLELFIPYFLTRQTITSYKRLKNFTTFLFIVITILVIPAIPEALTGKHYIHDFFSVVTGNPFYFRSEQRLGLWRAMSFIDNPIIFGAICSMGFVLALSLVERNFKYLGYVLVSLAGVIASVSSAPLLGIISQAVLFGWSKVMNKVTYKWGILLILTAIFYILIDLASNRDPFRVAFSYLLFSEHNGYVRYYMWINSFYLINQSFFSAIFGYGFSTDQFNLIDNLFFSNLMKRSVDSYWLVNLLRYGWPMFCFWFLLVFMVIKRNLYETSRVIKKPKEKNLLESWLIVTFGFTLISFTVHFWGSASSVYMIILACTSTSIVAKSKTKLSSQMNIDQYT